MEVDTIRKTDTSVVWMYVSVSGALQHDSRVSLADLETVLFEVASVHGQVASKFVGSCESLRTVGPGARVWLLSCVRAHVCLEVIGSRELSLAYVALERTDASVFTAVSTKLVRSRESFAATLMVADIRFLPSVLTDVHLQVGKLQIAFGAAGIEAHKRLSLLLRFGHNGLSTDELRRLWHLLSDLWDDEGRLR